MNMIRLISAENVYLYFWTQNGCFLLKILTLSFRNNDGFITKQEMLNTTSKLTAKQVWQNHKLWIKKEPRSDQTIGKDVFCAFKRYPLCLTATTKTATASCRRRSSRRWCWGRRTSRAKTRAGRRRKRRLDREVEQNCMKSQKTWMLTTELYFLNVIPLWCFDKLVHLQHHSNIASYVKYIKYYSVTFKSVKYICVSGLIGNFSPDCSILTKFTFKHSCTFDSEDSDLQSILLYERIDIPSLIDITYNEMPLYVWK